MFASTKFRFGANDDILYDKMCNLGNCSSVSCAKGKKLLPRLSLDNLGRDEVFFNKACLLECLTETGTLLIVILTHIYFYPHLHQKLCPSSRHTSSLILPFLSSVCTAILMAQQIWRPSFYLVIS